MLESRHSINECNVGLINKVTVESLYSNKVKSNLFSKKSDKAINYMLQVLFHHAERDKGLDYFRKYFSKIRELSAGCAASEDESVEIQNAFPLLHDLIHFYSGITQSYFGYNKKYSICCPSYLNINASDSLYNVIGEIIPHLQNQSKKEKWELYLEDNNVTVDRLFRLQKSLASESIYKTLLAQVDELIEHNHFIRADLKRIEAMSVYRDVDMEILYQHKILVECLNHLTSEYDRIQNLVFEKLSFDSLHLLSEELKRLNQLITYFDYKEPDFKGLEQKLHSQIDKEEDKNKRVRDKRIAQQYKALPTQIVADFQNKYAIYTASKPFTPVLNSSVEVSGKFKDNVTFTFSIYGNDINQYYGLKTKITANDFPVGEYTSEVIVELFHEVIFKSMKTYDDHGNLYINPDSIEVKITGAADGNRFRGFLKYDNEFGKADRSKYKNQNQKLAYVRALFVKDLIKNSDIPYLGSVDNYDINCEEFTEKGSEFRRIDLTISFRGLLSKIFHDLPESVQQEITTASIK